MGPIFKEKVTEKCNLWVREQCFCALFAEDLVNNRGLEKKKKGKRIKKKHGRANAQSKHSLNEPIISSTLNTIHPLVLMHLLLNDHKNNAHHLVFHSFLPQKKGM